MDVLRLIILAAVNLGQVSDPQNSPLPANSILTPRELTLVGDMTKVSHAPAYHGGPPRARRQQSAHPRPTPEPLVQYGALAKK